MLRCVLRGELRRFRDEINNFGRRLGSNPVRDEVDIVHGRAEATPLQIHPTKCGGALRSDLVVRLVFDVEVGVVFFQVRELGEVVVHDVGLARVRFEVVLVILLGAIERVERGDLRHDF
jgi:hypothetical protein